MSITALEKMTDGKSKVGCCFKSGSKSSSETDQSTTVNTTTTTTVGDLGLTGKDFVEVAGIFESGFTKLVDANLQTINRAEIENTARIGSVAETLKEVAAVAAPEIKPAIDPKLLVTIGGLILATQFLRN